MSPPLVVDTATAAERERGITAAAAAARRGDLVVLPTDTVYGVGTDAFSPAGVGRLLAAKGRGRDHPVPVLIGSSAVLPGLARLAAMPPWAPELVAAFWPGALTVVVPVQPSLAWDLGETAGTVALRMPLHPVALALLDRVGPMAVSSANRTGLPAATTCGEAQDQLGETVRVYLDAGQTPGPIPSTIVDLTTTPARVVRQGVLTLAELRTVAPELAAG